MEKVLLPTIIINKITSYVKDDATLTIKQQKNFIKKLLELWLFIYNKQIIDIKAISLKSYTNIHYKELESFIIVFPHIRYRYYNLIDILVELNILEVNEICKYGNVKGNFPYSYRILTPEINSMLSEINIDIQKVFNFNDEKYWITKNPKQQHLIKDVYNTKIDIISYYNWMIENEGMKLKPVFENGIVKKRFLTKERIQQYLLMAIKINIGCHWFKISNEGRFYSSITNLSYTTLPFLSLNSMKLVEIDIPNAQPLLLSTMINSNEYKNDVENANFYQRMADELEMEKGSFKILSYKYIFFSPKPLKSGKVYEAMNKIYPGVIEQINTLKEKFNGNLAVELQKMESKIIINNISKINIPKLTRHDSVLVYEAHEDRIKNELIKEFNKLNLNIKLKMKEVMDEVALEYNVFTKASYDGMSEDKLLNEPSIIKEKIVQPEECKREITYNYKGFKEVTITIRKEDILDFKIMIDKIKQLDFDISIGTLEKFNYFGYNKYKMDYMMNKKLNRTLTN